MLVFKKNPFRFLLPLFHISFSLGFKAILDSKNWSYMMRYSHRVLTVVLGFI